MLKNVAKILNFKYTIENPPDGSWGHIKADGSWNGLGMVSHNFSIVSNNFWKKAFNMDCAQQSIKVPKRVFI